MGLVVWTEEEVPDSPLATGAGQQGFELSSSTWVIALGFAPEGSNQSL